MREILGEWSSVIAVVTVIGDERGAQLSVARAAILDEEQCQRSQTVQLSAINDRPAFALSANQPGSG